jgi:proline racemase
MPDPRTLTYPEDGGTIATQEWTEQNYLPLSGDATANVTTNSLTAGTVKSGSPNTSGTIGPDAEGVHYQGTFITDGAVDIQNSAATATVMWRGVKIDGLGTITVK